MNLFRTPRRLAIIPALFLLVFSFALSACAKSPSMDPPPGSLLLDSNTYAGDVIAGILKKKLNQDDSILVTTMVNLDDFSKSSSFGRVSMQQIGSRVGQKGFRVIEARLGGEFLMEDGHGEFMLTRNAAKLMETEYDPAAVMVGVYSDKGSTVYMSVRAVRVSDGAVIAAYEYYLPKQGDTASLINEDAASGAWSQYAGRQKVGK